MLIIRSIVLLLVKGIISGIAVFVMFLNISFASQLRIQAPTTLYQGCFQPYIIKLDTNGIATKSIDVKLFLTGYFGIKIPFLDLHNALLTTTGYATYIPGYFQATTLQTGIATSGTYQNRKYLYINAYQFGGFSSISGNNLSVATLYLKANNFSTGYLHFYFINGWNGDDSNVSSGVDEGIISGSYTQYQDALTGVFDLIQTFSSDYACTSRPYITEAYYRQTGYISSTTGVQAVRTSIIAGPLYSGTSNRTIRTKTPVYLTLTGVSDSYPGSGGLIADNLSTGIQLTYVTALNHPFISRVGNTTGWYHQYHTIVITGNVTTGFVGFDNIIGNTGSTYSTGGNNYTHTFMIDVFWIDTVSPVNTGYFTGYIAETGINYTLYILSGKNFEGWISNPTSGFHAVWTDIDDEYKVISFSGTNSITQNCVDLGYPCTTTGYMRYLNTTGYVWSGNNIFKLEHTLVFTTSFSGYVTVIDRAGNTGQWYIEVNMDEQLEVLYGILAYPQVGVARNQLTNLSGMLLKIAIYKGGFDKERLLGSGGAGIQLVYTGRVKTSTTGRAQFTGNFTSGTYRVLAEGANTLSYLLSGVSLSPLGGLIDFTSVYTGGFVFGDLYRIVTTLDSKHGSYLSDGADRDSIVNITDLARLVTIRGEFNTMDTNPNLGVYSGSYFVDIPIGGTGTKIIPKSLLQTTPYTISYMQYHPYDIDANGLIDSTDYAFALTNYGSIGATQGGKLNGISTATMPF